MVSGTYFFWRLNNSFASGIGPFHTLLQHFNGVVRRFQCDSFQLLCTSEKPEESLGLNQYKRPSGWLQMAGAGLSSLRFLALFIRPPAASSTDNNILPNLPIQDFQRKNITRNISLTKAPEPADISKWTLIPTPISTVTS